jgi:hypothetical protein
MKPVGTYRQGYLLLGCPGPWRLAIRDLPFLPSGGRGIRPGSDSWDRGLRTLPVLFRNRGPHVPRKAGEISGSPRPGRSGAATCDGRTITGQTAPTSPGGPDPLPPGRGPAPPRAVLRWERGWPCHVPTARGPSRVSSPPTSI